VRVSRNNELIGATSSTGEVLIANAPVLTRNDILIADGDVPISIAVPTNRQVLVPAQGVGYRVRFDLRPLMSIVGTLVRESRRRQGRGGEYGIDSAQRAHRKRSARAPARTASSRSTRSRPAATTCPRTMEEGPCGVHVEIPPERKPVLRLGEVKCEIAAHF
jgi:hypothetical protein